jgi:CheY-like chemotaxis protein
MTGASHDNLLHLISDTPRVLVVDGSRLVRKMIGDVLRGSLPGVDIAQAGTLAEARAQLEAGPVHLVTTALEFADGDGLRLARLVRESAGQAYVPVIVVSGNAQEALETRHFSEDITDYFDKSLGQRALAEFIQGYVRPEPIPGARVLYVEDSRVVAAATRRMLERHQMQVTHFAEADAALEYLHRFRGATDVGTDLLLTDVYLKGALSGHDLLSQVRGAFGYGKRRLPVLVMTGDANRDNQASLLREGANDLVIKPIEERLLVTKALFQLRLARLPEAGAAAG